MVSTAFVPKPLYSIVLAVAIQVGERDFVDQIRSPQPIEANNVKLTRNPTSGEERVLDRADQHLHGFASVMTRLVELDRHNHFDRDRLAVELRRLILPLAQSAKRSPSQQFRAGDDPHFRYVAVFVDRRVDHHGALHIRLLRDLWINWQDR